MFYGFSATAGQMRESIEPRELAVVSGLQFPQSRNYSFSVKPDTAQPDRAAGQVSRKLRGELILSCRV
jgi:hypothetical protein